VDNPKAATDEALLHRIPYHEREEGVDPCGFPHSGDGSHVSLVAARRRVSHGRATLVRPGLTARLVRLVHRQAPLLPRQLSTSILSTSRQKLVSAGR
jgi:hypothetical protein